MRSELWHVLQANPKAKVADPIPGMIVAINKYLQAYHMYRAEALSRPEVSRLDTMSRDALATLQKVFPFGVQLLDGTLSLFLVHREAALHGALGEQLENRGPAPHHLHKRHRGPDEDGRQDQGEEDQQPSIVWRQHPQGQHGGGGGDRAGARPGRDRYALRVPRCWIAPCVARFA
jgi:hypothetical protein